MVQRQFSQDSQKMYRNYLEQEAEIRELQENLMEMTLLEKSTVDSLEKLKHNYENLTTKIV